MISAIIKKKKKEDFMDTIDSAAGKFEGTKKVQSEKLRGSDKVKSSPVPKSESPESKLDIETMLMSAKKEKKEAPWEGKDSYTKEKGYYQSEDMKKKYKKMLMDMGKNGKY